MPSCSTTTLLSEGWTHCSSFHPSAWRVPSAAFGRLHDEPQQGTNRLGSSPLSCQVCFQRAQKGPFFSSTPRSAYGSCEKAVRPVLSPVLFQALLQELVSQQGRAGCPNLRHGAGFFAVVFTECSEMGPSGSVTFSSDLQTPRAGKYLLLHQVTELFPAVTGSKTAQEKTVLLLQSFPFHQIHQPKHAT